MPHSVNKAHVKSQIAHCPFPRRIWLVLGVLVMAACGVDHPLSPNQRVARLEKVSADSQVFDFPTNVSLTHSVRVLDAKGKPVGGASVKYDYGFSFNYDGNYDPSASVKSNSAGIATLPEWKLRFLGEQHLTAWVDGANTIKFVATIRCVARQSIEVGVPVTGTLAGGDCAETCEYCGLGFEDNLSFVNASASMVKMNVTSSDGLYTSIWLTDTESHALAWSPYDQSLPGFWAIIPPGNYEIALRGNEPRSYELTLDGPVTDPGCFLVFILRGVTTSQSLDSLDCVDQSRYVDSFFVVLHTGQTVTASLASSSFDSVLELEHTGYYDYTAPPPITRSSGTPGVPAHLTGSCKEGNCIFRILATSQTNLTTGAYTLSVLP